MATGRWSPGMVVVLMVLLVAGCGSPSVDEDPDPPSPTGQPAPPAVPAPTALAPGTTVTIDLADRPLQLRVPQSYDPAVPVPLVVLLHGYSSDAARQESYFQLAAESDRHGFLYAMPEGTTTSDGSRFWNATETCCDFERSGVDDAGYLRRLVETVTASYPVDPSRVYLVGHSNGGFMAHRMACEHADAVTAIVSLAGSATADPAECSPAHPVAILQIHGTDDETIRFDGGTIAGRQYPAAPAIVERWRQLNGCADQADQAAPLDLDSSVPGAETTVTAYTTGCRAGSRVELWSVVEGSHSPALTADFAPAVVDFLYAQETPAT